MANGKSKEQRRRHSSEFRTGNSISKSWVKWGGAAAALIAVLIVIAISQLGEASPANTSADNRITAPDFLLTAYQGADALGSEELRFSDIFSQGKPVVLNFWAGLCPPCRAEMPFFQIVYDELGDQFILVGLDIGPFIGLGSNEDGQNLLQELNITYPAGTTFDAGIVAAFNIRGMPTTVFLKSDGTIFDVHIGILDEATLREKVDELIQASQAS